MILRAFYGLAVPFLLAFSVAASPQLRARAEEASLPEASSSRALLQDKNKPLPPDPTIYHSNPRRGDFMMFSHFGAPLDYENLATACIDGMLQTYLMSKTGDDHVPNGEYKRMKQSFQLDIGLDLYSESDFPLDDLAMVLNSINRWGLQYQAREFRFQWFHRNKQYLMGSFRNAPRLVSGIGNGTETA